MKSCKNQLMRLLKTLGGSTDCRLSTKAGPWRLSSDFLFLRITAAGICPDEPFLERDPKSVARCFEINTLGTYYAAQLVAKQMTTQAPTDFNPHGGSIVFVASIAAYVASKGQCTSDYCSSKGAVVSLAKALGVELAAHHIRVNSISPG